MNIENKDFIFTAFGVSGREDKVRGKIEQFAKTRVDKISYDTTGSLICLKKGKGKKPRKVMVTAHMDTIGFVVTYIDERGFLRFSEVGYQPEVYLLGRRVIFENGTIGVIGIEKHEDKKNLKKDKMFIDIGAGDRGQTAKKVKVGDMCAIYSPYTVTDCVITGAWMDDRIGCFVVLEVMENVKNNHNDIIFVFSSQEEVGLRGAQTSAYRIEPDVGLAVDVTDSSDLPEGDRFGTSVIGKGAAIKLMDRSVIVQKKFVEYLVNLAEKNRIPHQRDVLTIGGTDTHAIQLSRGGAVAGGVSIPTRYVHSSGEMCALSDVQACVDIVLRFCEQEEVLGI
jgi:endoglucanase